MVRVLGLRRIGLQVQPSVHRREHDALLGRREVGAHASSAPPKADRLIVALLPGADVLEQALMCVWAAKQPLPSHAKQWASREGERSPLYSNRTVLSAACWIRPATVRESGSTPGSTPENPATPGCEQQV